MEIVHPMLDPKRLRSAMQHWHIDCGKRLRAQRESMGLSQVTLAKLVGVTVPSVSRFELGLQAPRDSVRHAIACALCCQVTDIWPPMDRVHVQLIAKAA